MFGQLISPIAGVFVDKWNLKTTMIGSDLVRGLLVLALLFVRDVNAIYAILFAMSVFSSFFTPAQAVAARTLAPAGGLLAVNALMSQAMQGAQIITPSVSGVLVDWLGAEELARRLAPHLARAGWRPVLAPGLPYGTSRLAERWSGTISLSTATLARVIVEIVRGLASHGFRPCMIANYR